MPRIKAAPQGMRLLRLLQGQGNCKKRCINAEILKEPLQTVSALFKAKERQGTIYTPYPACDKRAGASFNISL